MKKLAKLAALLASAALLFGAAGCSGDDDDDPKSEPTLKSISVTANEDVKDHYNGDETEFDHTGLTVTAHYSDETTKDVTGDATFTATYKDEDGAEKPFPVAEKNIYKVTVTAHYEGMEDTLKDPIIITVGDVELESISVSGTLTKKSYKQGADLDYTGITVTAYYDVGEPVVIPNDDVEFTATYGDDNSEFTTSLPPDEYLVTLTAKYKGKEASLDPVTITIKEADDDDDDDEEETYFTEFVAETVSDANVDSAQAFKADDGTWSVTSAKYQKTDSNSNPVTLETYDYADGTGYSYSGRIKVQKSGVFTIKTKAGTVLRIDGGSPTTGKDRTLTITGADKAKWTANTNGTFFLTATAATVTMTADDEFNIYGIHTAEEAVTPTVLATKYSNLVVTLSKHSCLINAEVTAKATLTKEETTTEGLTTKTETVDVTADVSWEGEGVTVTNGKVDTSSEGTLTITATYTYGDEKSISSVAVTLEVAGAWNPADPAEITNEELGLTAATATSADEKVATVKQTDTGITITAVNEGTTTVTVEDANGNKATVDVEVSAGGSITTTVHKYAEATEDSWTITTEAYAAIRNVTTATTPANYEMKGAKNALTATFYKSGAKGHGKTTTSNSVSYAGDGSWAASPAISGGKVKNDFLKISDIKGAVTLTVKWAMNSAQSAGNRNLEVTVGDDKEKCVPTPCDANKGAQADYVVNFDAGDGTNVYIGASNEICLVSVTIEAQK